MIAFQQVSSDIVDLEQVLISFINENDRSASALVIGRPKPLVFHKILCWTIILHSIHQ